MEFEDGRRRYRRKMITEIVLLVLEIIGTIAFAVSGALVAIKAKFDVFGVLVVGCVTAVGGRYYRRKDSVFKYHLLLFY